LIRFDTETQNFIGSVSEVLPTTIHSTEGKEAKEKTKNPTSTPGTALALEKKTKKMIALFSRIRRTTKASVFLQQKATSTSSTTSNIIVQQAVKGETSSIAIVATTSRTTRFASSSSSSSSPSSSSTIITAAPRKIWFQQQQQEGAFHHLRHRQRNRQRRWNTTTTTTKQTNKVIPPPLQVLPPTIEQLRIVAFRAGIPMIGFGIMDNVVMITAGEAIDSTFGVTLGISTMAAAGFGQCCSDVAGITSGGIVDATVSKLNLKHHGLTPAQLDLRKTRLYSTFGACVGVVTGCLMGMSVLLFMDTDRADRAKRSKELKSIFESVMNDGHLLVGAERATLFMVDESSQELWSQVATGITTSDTKEKGNNNKKNKSNKSYTKDGIIKCSLNEGIVGHSVTTGQIVNVPNAYEDARFNSKVDDITGFKTISVIVVPVFAKDDDDDNDNDNDTDHKNGKVIGAIQMLNKKIESSCDDDPNGIRRANTTTIVPFNESDEKILKVLASHVASFISVVDS
jgi:hypothetical protein